MSSGVTQDLFVRFVGSLSEEELQDVNRVMFHLQEAHWFYIDYIAPVERGDIAPIKRGDIAPIQRDIAPALAQGHGSPAVNHDISTPVGSDNPMAGDDSDHDDIGFKGFVYHMAPLLGWRRGQVAELVRKFWKYSSQIPRCGGLLVNRRKNKILLVRGYGAKKWSFPVGKVNFEEPFNKCAEREVFEETGFHGIASEDLITYKKKKAVHRLFLFYNVPEDYDFEPQTRKEIDEIKWFELEDVSRMVNIRPFQKELSEFLGLPVDEFLGHPVDDSKLLHDEPSPPESESQSTSIESSPDLHSQKPPADPPDVDPLLSWAPFDPLPPPRSLLAPKLRWTRPSLNCT